MKINIKKHSVTLFLIFISLLALVSSASATTYPPIVQPPYSGIIIPSPIKYLFPHASFTYENLLAPGDYYIQFTDTSTGLIVSWCWDFGQGYPLVYEQNPLFRFGAPLGSGTWGFPVTLKVTDLWGHTSSTTQWVNDIKI